MEELEQKVRLQGSRKLPFRIHRVLVVFMEASNYARDLGCDIWEFAVEMACLRQHRLTNNDIRWLLAKGYVEHAREITEPGDVKRQFRHGQNCVFSKRSAFVLPPAGMELVERLVRHGTLHHNGRLRKSNPRPATAHVLPAEPQESGAAAKPTWDRDRHELRVGDLIAKAYKVPSPNQETILTVFEEEGWPPRIDDPLPPHPELIAKRRLHDTIKALNRNQKRRLVRFLGDGTGEGIRWEFWRIEHEHRSADDGESG